MAFKVAIASGKGGTGKTTVSVSLAQALFKQISKSVLLVDCDVEEPNDFLFYDEPKMVSEQVINQMIPVIDTDACTFCSACASICTFNAIVVIPKAGIARVDPDLCHSCGACLYACNYKAIHEVPENTGMVRQYETQDGPTLYEGRLKVGSHMQTFVIKALKKLIPQNGGIVLYDAPPGTSCSVVATVSDADYVILVTEPTPFGLHDLKLAVKLLRGLKRLFGVVINKNNNAFNNLKQYLKDESIPVLGEIPYSREFAHLYSRGNLLNNAPASISETFSTIAAIILEKSKGK